VQRGDLRFQLGLVQCGLPGVVAQRAARGAR